MDPPQLKETALAALRHLAQQHYDYLIVVEDQATKDLLESVALDQRKFIASNLRQLGCDRLTFEAARHSAKVVIELIEFANTQLETAGRNGSEHLLLKQLRGVVDRDICPSYSPRSAAIGLPPPSRHASALATVRQLRCTPLNDVETTMFVDDLARLLERLEVVQQAAMDFDLPPDCSSSQVADTIVREWLVPLFCVRSFFARQTPPIRTKNLAVLIGTWALPRMVASSGLERGLQIAQSVPGAFDALLPDQLEDLRCELEAASNARELWSHLVHGHDLMRVLGMLCALATGAGPIPAADFSTETTDGRPNAGMRELLKRERDALGQSLRGGAGFFHERAKQFFAALFD